MAIERTKATIYSELRKQAWSSGIIYFVAHDGNPEPAFYDVLPPLLAHEKVMEVLVEDKDSFFDSLQSSRRLPCFGAIASGFAVGFAEDPQDTEGILDMVMASRKICVLPSDLEDARRNPRKPILLEGVGSDDDGEIPLDDT